MSTLAVALVVVIVIVTGWLIFCVVRKRTPAPGLDSDMRNGEEADLSKKLREGFDEFSEDSDTP